MSETKTRLVEYDIIRIIAILAVIMIHVSAPYVTDNEPNSIKFIIGNILDSISRIGVPFFILISGTFMLDEFRNVSISKLKNKIIKLSIILVIWSAFYALIYHFHEFMHAFMYGHYHLWYLYFIIGLYLITPVLRLFVKKENLKYIYYIILLAIIFNFIPKTLDGLFSYNNSISDFFNLFSLNCVSTFVSYYIAGWLIKEDWNNICKYKNIQIIILIISLISIILFTQLRMKVDFQAYEYFYNNSNFLVFSYSISFFALLKMLFTKYQSLNNKIKTIIIKLSNLTLGVYLIHASVLALLQSIARHLAIHSLIVNILFCYLGTVILSFFFCYLISKIKYINKLIQI